MNTIRECLQSQDRRRQYHKRLRQLALHGGEDNRAVHQNKLWTWGESSSAYCYAPEFVKFGVSLPKRYGDEWIEELDALRDEADDLFRNTGLDASFGLGVEWAHFLPCMYFKVKTDRDHVTVDLVHDPADVSVWEENLPFEDQEAIVHSYEMNLHAVIRLIYGGVANRAEAERLIGIARDIKTRGPSSGALAPAIPSLVLAAASPNMIGAVQNMKPITIGEPEVAADMVPMCELWIKDDYAYQACARCGHREEEFAHRQGPFRDHPFMPSPNFEWEWRRVLTMGPNGDHYLWDVLNPLLPQRQPLRQLCLRPITNYAYGNAPQEQMIMLQKWGEDLLSKHDLLLELQLDPPIAYIGMGGGVDGERAKLLRQPGGDFATSFSPGQEIKRMVPDTPPDTPGMHKLIDDKFNQEGGLPAGSSGTSNDPNVRSAGQMTAGAALSSPRTNRRAMRVEDTLEEVMTDALRLHRRMCKDALRIPLPQPDPETGKNWRQFYISEVPEDLNVRVSAHSASPLFRNEMREIATILRREQAISKEVFIELLSPPLEDILRPKARKMEASEAQAKQQILAAKKAEADAKMIAAKAKAQRDAVS